MVGRLGVEPFLMVGGGRGREGEERRERLVRKVAVVGQRNEGERWRGPGKVGNKYRGKNPRMQNNEPRIARSSINTQPPPPHARTRPAQHPPSSPLPPSSAGPTDNHLSASPLVGSRCTPSRSTPPKRVGGQVRAEVVGEDVLGIYFPERLEGGKDDRVIGIK